MNVFDMKFSGDEFSHGIFMLNDQSCTVTYLGKVKNPESGGGMVHKFSIVHCPALTKVNGMGVEEYFFASLDADPTSDDKIGAKVVIEDSATGKIIPVGRALLSRKLDK